MKQPYTQKDKQVFRPVFMKHLKQGSYFFFVFIVVAFSEALRRTGSKMDALYFLIVYFIPFLSLALSIYYFKFLHDFLTKYKTVRTGYLNIVNVFEKPAKSHIQIIFEDNKYLNFTLDYEEAINLQQGTNVQVAHTRMSKYLLSIEPVER